MKEEYGKDKEAQAFGLFQSERQHRPGWGAGISGSDWESKVFEFVWKEPEKGMHENQNKKKGGDTRWKSKN